MGFSDLAVQEMKREPKRATPSRLLASFFVRSLTLAPRSLLRNSTETLATQASLAQASSQRSSHGYFLNMFSYLGKHLRLIIVSQSIRRFWVVSGEKRKDGSEKGRELKERNFLSLLPPPPFPI